MIGTSQQMLLPQYGLFFQRALQPENGYIFWSIGCSGCTDPESRCTQCDSCRRSSDNAKKYASRVHPPRPPAISHNSTNVRHIVSDPTKAEMEIKRLCRRVKKLWRARVREVFCRGLAINGRAVDRAKLAKVRGAADAVNAAVQSALLEGSAAEELDL